MWAADLGGLTQKKPVPRFPETAARLRAIRAERNLTQEALAAMAKAGMKAYGRWERGETEPRASHIANICNALAISADYLIGRVDAESGLTPGFVIVDLDLLARAESDPYHDYDPAIRVPRRTRVLSHDNWEQELARVNKARRDAKGR